MFARPGARILQVRHPQLSSIQRGNTGRRVVIGSQYILFLVINEYVSFVLC
jgi:hypothetical protein